MTDANGDEKALQASAMQIALAQRDAAKRRETCMAAIQAALKEHFCELDVVVELSVRGFKPVITVIALAKPESK